METNEKTYLLLFDVGGTWTKFAIAENNEIISKKILLTSSFGVDDIKLIVEETGYTFQYIIIACAGPVKDGRCKMTNAAHTFDQKILSEQLKINVKVMNDLEAIAYGLRSEYASSLIVEIGTGLGVSYISEKKDVFPSEEGHILINKELFMSIPEINKQPLIPEYEHLLSGKKNLFMKNFKKTIVNLVQKEKNSKHDRFTELYIQVLNEFIYKLIEDHSKEKIKRIIFTGGVISGNIDYMNNYISELKLKLASENKGITDVVIIEDEFLGIKGTLAYYKEKKRKTLIGRKIVLP
jgi:hypothetical protein